MYSPRAMLLLHGYHADLHTFFALLVCVLYETIGNGRFHGLAFFLSLSKGQN
jgi:hypothetical protein